MITWHPFFELEICLRSPWKSYREVQKHWVWKSTNWRIILVGSWISCKQWWAIPRQLLYQKWSLMWQCVTLPHIKSYLMDVIHNLDLQGLPSTNISYSPTKAREPNAESESVPQSAMELCSTRSKKSKEAKEIVWSCFYVIQSNSPFLDFGFSGSTEGIRTSSNTSSLRLRWKCQMYIPLRGTWALGWRL